MTKAIAKKYKLKNVSDLSKVAKKLVFGGPPECETRDLCLGPKAQQTYGLKFQEVKKLDVGGPLTVKALEVTVGIRVNRSGGADQLLHRLLRLLRHLCGQRLVHVCWR